jgi:hypothetical protein
MNFINPWAAWLGIGALALPVAIHWLTRPRPIRLPFSTVRFIREAVRERRARDRIRDWIVLALRTAAAFLLAWVVARPMFGHQPVVTPGESGDAVRVVMVDVSHSLAAEQGGIQIFERARSVAARYLTEQTGQEANLILAGAVPRPAFDRFSGNFGALRAELAGAAPRPERLRVQPALSMAAEMLAQAAPSQRRELVIVSDFQRNNWAEADFTPLPQDTRIQLESVAPAETLPNLAVLGVAAQGRLERGQEVRLEVEVGNFTPQTRPVQVELSLGEAVYRLEGTCPPGSSTLSVPVMLAQAGWLTGEARLVDVTDALPGDNVRAVAIEVRPPPSYVLLTREPAEQRPSASYYLERALLPRLPRAGRTDERVARMDPSALDRETLLAADAIVIVSPGRLGNELIQLLTTLLRRGRGVLYVANEPADATNLQLLADAGGRDLQMPVEFGPPPAALGRRNLFLTEVRKELGPFAVFGDNLNSLIATLRFTGGLSTRQREGALADDLRALFNDRSACLVVTSCGQGTLAVLNCDLPASNLPSSSAFVPLMGELMGMASRRKRIEPVASGEATAANLPLTVGPLAGLQLVGPSEQRGQLVEEDSGPVWRWPAAGPPGVYQVRKQDTTVFALASVIPAQASDLRTIEPDLLRRRLAGGRSVHYRAANAEDEDHDTYWSWLAVALVGCLLVEVVALKVFRT